MSLPRKKAIRKNEALLKVASSISKDFDKILSANEKDVNPHLALSPFIELANQIYKIQKWNETEKDATFAVTVVKGGIDGTCVIPETASFTMDVRYRTEDAMKRNHERILAMRAEDNRYTLSVQGRIDKPIMNGDKYLYKMLERIGLDYDSTDAAANSDQPASTDTATDAEPQPTSDDAAK